VEHDFGEHDDKESLGGEEGAAGEDEGAGGVEHDDKESLGGEEGGGGGGRAGGPEVEAVNRGAELRSPNGERESLSTLAVAIPRPASALAAGPFSAGRLLSSLGGAALHVADGSASTVSRIAGGTPESLPRILESKGAESESTSSSLTTI